MTEETRMSPAGNNIASDTPSDTPATMISAIW